MAANCVRKALQSSSGSAKTLLSRSSSLSLPSKASSFGGIPSARTASTSRLSFQKLTPFSLSDALVKWCEEKIRNVFNFCHKNCSKERRLCRHPVELASLQSLMPLHSVIASALYNSLLSLHNEAWGCLSEGFATPL